VCVLLAITAVLIHQYAFIFNEITPHKQVKVGSWRKPLLQHTGDVHCTPNSFSNVLGLDVATAADLRRQCDWSAITPGFVSIYVFAVIVVVSSWRLGLKLCSVRPYRRTPLSAIASFGSGCLLVCYDGHTFGVACQKKLAFDPASDSRALDFAKASPEAVAKFFGGDLGSQCTVLHVH
jgi:hypothetical protein